MYKFEWVCRNVYDQKTFDAYIEHTRQKWNSMGTNETAAFLYLDDEEGHVVTVCFDVPCLNQVESNPDICPWLNAYHAHYMDDEDFTRPLCEMWKSNIPITYENAEKVMLNFANEMCRKLAEKEKKNKE